MPVFGLPTRRVGVAGGFWVALGGRPALGEGETASKIASSGPVLPADPEAQSGAEPGRLRAAEPAKSPSAVIPS